MDLISEKILEAYPGLVVRKDLSNLLKRGLNVPSFVLEYLLGLYCATDDEQVLSVGLKKIQKVLTENFVSPEDSELIKFKIRDKGSYTIIDKLSAELSKDGTMYIGKFSNLQLNNIQVNEDMIKENVKILGEGIWVMAKVSFVSSKEEEDYNNIFKNSLENDYIVENSSMIDKKKKLKKAGKIEKSVLEARNNPFEIENIKPIQMPNFDLESFIEKRSYFTTNEWIDLLLRSVGINTTSLNEKEKFHFLERLVPMIEKNYNLVELGPRGTGKSHMYKEISPYTILVSGGYASPSLLFYNISRKSTGLVSTWDVVAFDEVAGMRLKDTEVVQVMKDYMASGSFVRGKNSINADSSFVFVGNINDTVENLMIHSTLFEPFPKEVNMDAAFFDRIHYYLPGWEVPKIRSNMLTDEYGFINDAISEFFSKMRREDFSHILDNDIKFNKSLNIRDDIAVRKTISGLMKLIYPNRKYDINEAEKIVQYALEGRRRVKEQLKKMVGDEFADVNLGYITKDKYLKIVNVPEKQEEQLIDSNKQQCGVVWTLGKTNEGFVAVYKLENKFIPGKGLFKVQGLIGGENKKADQSMNSAWINFKEFLNSVNLDCSQFDALCNLRDLQNRGISSNISVAELVGLISAFLNKNIKPETIIVGDISLTGVIDEVKNVIDYIRSAYNAGAKYLLLPSNTKKDIENLSQSIYNQVELQFYDDINSALKIIFAENNLVN